MLAQPDPRLDQARRFIKEKRHGEARAILVNILKANPNDVTCLYLYAHVARNWQEAEKVLKRVLELEPFNYQARAALNKLQKRSVEQIPPQKATSTEVAAGVSTFLYAVGAALVITIVIVGIAAIAALSGGGDVDDSLPTPGNVAENSVLPATTPTMRVDEPTAFVEVGELPATWTLEPSATIKPTRTIAPSSTPQPTKTTFPTLTATPPVVEALAFSLPVLSRLYNDYQQLAAQSAWATDQPTLQNIAEALAAIVASLELSEYHLDTELAEGWVDYLDELVLLMNQEHEITLSRQQVLELQADGSNTTAAENEVEEHLENRYSQQQKVETQLFSLVNAATATSEWLERVDALKTPSVTPMLVPTTTLAPVEEQ